MMKLKIFCLLTLWAHCCAFSATSFEVDAVVVDSGSKLVFPTVRISTEGQRETSVVDDCRYSVLLTKPEDAMVQLEAQLSCDQEDDFYQMELPIMVVDELGGDVDYELVDEQNAVWRYSVSLRRIL
ncbi:hypothetical protein [Ferrimonas aestuarii]|uniref:DUF3244 domain-containing protein n=1 Tax=Ferrimonas aestuarii TaxID=2569539 RepID=A0A4U1BDG0_9GAMM|nr:hypothetical protein [Ferrimonas aestuarii]TKB49157.1 hypothetical protein FCL42_20860 [Ferrimonas aestuarii]